MLAICNLFADRFQTHDIPSLRVGYWISKYAYVNALHQLLHQRICLSPQALRCLCFIEDGDDFTLGVERGDWDVFSIDIVAI